MSTTAPAHGTVPRASPGYLHDVLFWSGERDFVTQTGAFVREGVAAGEPVLVAVPEPRSRALQRHLGRAGDEVRFVDMAALGANPACIIDAWSRFAEECGEQPSRGVGEPLWPGRREAEIAECELHEALLNVAIGAQRPLWLRCPYDADGLPGTVLERARGAHPFLASTDGGTGTSDGYAGDGLGLEGFTTPLPEPATQPVVRRIADLATLKALRDLVVHAATVAGVGRDRSIDLGLAVHELAVNTITHGDGSGRLRLWRDPAALVCEVSDDGVVLDPLAGRHHPAEEAAQGRGLWMVNQLCDLVQLRSGTQGTQVRIHTWL
jgi:anti-sigma regulatory factor (Ser/Thr protein kinase)